MKYHLEYIDIAGNKLAKESYDDLFTAKKYGLKALKDNEKVKAIFIYDDNGNEVFSKEEETNMEENLKEEIEQPVEEVTDEDISVALADYTWQISDEDTVESYAQATAEKLGVDKERVIEIIKREDPERITNETKMVDLLFDLDFEESLTEDEGRKNINLKAFGFVRAPEEDFTDDGARFICYYYDPEGKGDKRIRLSKHIYNGQAYLSAHYTAAGSGRSKYFDDLNGVSIQTAIDGLPKLKADIDAFLKDTKDFDKVTTLSDEDVAKIAEEAKWLMQRAGLNEYAAVKRAYANLGIEYDTVPYEEQRKVNNAMRNARPYDKKELEREVKEMIKDVVKEMTSYSSGYSSRTYSYHNAKSIDEAIKATKWRINDYPDAVQDKVVKHIKDSLEKLFAFKDEALKEEKINGVVVNVDKIVKEIMADLDSKDFSEALNEDEIDTENIEVVSGEPIEDEQPIEDAVAEVTDDQVKLGMSTMISEAISEEWKKVDQYNSMIATAQAEGASQDVIDLFQKSVDNIMLNIAQLEKSLSLIAPELVYSKEAFEEDQPEEEVEIKDEEEIEESAKLTLSEEVEEIEMERDGEDNNKYLIIEGTRRGYGIDQVEDETITVGELKDILEYYDNDMRVVIGNDWQSGYYYTYGPINEDTMKEVTIVENRSNDYDEKLEADHPLDEAFDKEKYKEKAEELLNAEELKAVKDKIKIDYKLDKNEAVGPVVTFGDTVIGNLETSSAKDLIKLIKSAVELKESLNEENGEKDLFARLNNLKYGTNNSDSINSHEDELIATLDEIQKLEPDKLTKQELNDLIYYCGEIGENLYWIRNEFKKQKGLQLSAEYTKLEKKFKDEFAKRKNEALEEGKGIDPEEFDKAMEFLDNLEGLDIDAYEYYREALEGLYHNDHASHETHGYTSIKGILDDAQKAAQDKGELEEAYNGEEVTVHVYDIDWETDGEEVDLPKDVQITVEHTPDDNPDLDEANLEEEILNELSNEYGWLINNFSYELYSNESMQANIEKNLQQEEQLDESKKDDVTNWWKEVEDKYGDIFFISNGDYSDVEGMHAAMFDMLRDLKDIDPELFKKGKTIYNKYNPLSKFNEDTTIKVDPDKMKEIEIEDPFDDGDDLGHPIKQGLGDEVEEIRQEADQDLYMWILDLEDELEEGIYYDAIDAGLKVEDIFDPNKEIAENSLVKVIGTAKQIADLAKVSEEEVKKAVNRPMSAVRPYKQETTDEELVEVWSNGSGPGFYETFDYITQDLEKENINYDTFEDDEETQFIIDEADKQAADEIICNWVGEDYRITEPDPDGKISFVVDRKILYRD